MTEERFNKYFSTFIIIGMTVAITAITVMKFDCPPKERVLLIVTFVSSLMGIMSTVLSASGIIWNYAFGIINILIYGSICLFSHNYGNAMQHFLFSLPMQIIGISQWRKRGASGKKAVEGRRMSSGKRWMYLALTVAATAVLYLILLRYNRSAADNFLRYAVLADAFSAVCNILGQIFMAAAYMEQWVFWIGVNVASIIMWATNPEYAGSGFSLIYVAKYGFYLLNALNGFRIWMKLSRKNSLEM